MDPNLFRYIWPHSRREQIVVLLLILMAVGGCAGCTVRVNTPEGPAMKRVCVDGPVFPAEYVVWE